MYYLHFKDGGTYYTKTKDLKEAKEMAKRIKGTISTLKNNNYKLVCDYSTNDILAF